ncbi:MAG TPA: M17 family peptidase N-terminal domain-containing protein, partial [Candidatus Binatia bacterium]
MEIRLKDQSPEKIKTPLLAMPVMEDGLNDPLLQRLDRHLKKSLSRRIHLCKFTGAEGSVLLHPTEGQLAASHVLLVGMG